LPITVGEIFPFGLPAIATAAVLGILVNLIFLIFEPPAVTELGKLDDFQRIEGIGPKAARSLRQAGIINFAQLAEANIDQLKTILKEADLATLNPETWPSQARLAASEKWDELEAMQKNLMAGRKQ
ncbi:MAG: helix-hairpin-helix domain-containing protein, partial [Anaerolineae bacterium]|nr:helix-hairpin-helix domain-containing protein [Anaerolineae bacterium]